MTKSDSNMKPGRNDPCPCGSGKKYKKCCLLKNEPNRPLTKQLLHDASHRAAELLLDYAGRIHELPDKPPLGVPVPDFGKDEEAARTLHAGVILQWLFYHYLPDISDPEMGIPSDQTIAARFLREEGHALDGQTRRFIEEACREPFTYWQVEAVDSGKGLLLTDMVLGRERYVHEMSMSREAQRSDVLFGQIVGLDGTSILNAVGPYGFPPHRFRWRIEYLIESLGLDLDDPDDTNELLFRSSEFMEHHLLCIQELLTPTYPELRNTDGDKLVHTTSAYSFHPNRHTDILLAFKSMRNINYEHDDAEELVFVWSVFPRNKPGRRQRTVKGMLRLSEDTLTTECNSKARDRKLRKRLEKDLRGIIRHISTTEKTLAPGVMPKQGPASEPLDIAALAPNDQAKIEEALEGQYMDWADTKVPLLDNRTPREVVRTAMGKARVETMINEWEHMHRGNVPRQYEFDFNKLRKELGLALE